MEINTAHSSLRPNVLPAGWRLEPLGDHVVIKSGESPSRFQFSDKGTPYFKVEQLKNSLKYQEDTPYFISENDSQPVVKKGSVIFPKRGASIMLNKVRILKHDSFMDTNMMTLTFDDEVLSEYAYYALLHIGLWRVADTTSIPQINNKHNAN